MLDLNAKRRNGRFAVPCALLVSLLAKQSQRNNQSATQHCSRDRQNGDVHGSDMVRKGRNLFDNVLNSKEYKNQDLKMKAYVEMAKTVGFSWTSPF